jgi:hypothetical protein
MARKRTRAHGVPLLSARERPTIFGVRSEDRFVVNKPEHDAWHLFLRWCSHIPEGTKVELLRHDKVVACLLSAGTGKLLDDRVVA